MERAAEYDTVRGWRMGLVLFAGLSGLGLTLLGVNGASVAPSAGIANLADGFVVTGILGAAMSAAWGWLSREDRED